LRNLDIKIKLLQSANDLESLYLPYGVTTIATELSNKGESNRKLLLRPTNRLPPPEYVAHESLKDEKNSSSKDLKIIWGGGMTQGFELNLSPNNKTNLFYLVIHDSDDLSVYGFDLEVVDVTRNGEKEKIITTKAIRLKPPEGSNGCVKVIKKYFGVYSRVAEFQGEIIPNYQSRWFRRDNKYSFSKNQAPNFVLRYDEDMEGFITSNIRIGIRTTKGIEDIGKIGGDLERSRLHAELFNFVDKYCVLRVWLYWTNDYFSKNRFIEGRIQHGSRQTTELRAWKQRLIEVPDAERFDLVIDKETRKIIYIGTDLHWRETWWSVNDDFVNLKFAEMELVPVLIKNLPQILGPYIAKHFKNDLPSDYDPAIALKEDLTKGAKPVGDPTLVVQEDTKMVSASGDTVLGHGLHRKHVPYVMNFNLMPRFVSSVLTQL